ncbi:MAG: regulatory protein RecX [Chlamydiales bacterium]|nr:regulatory protein RecX [Chlamydiales bacterium]
MIDVLIHENVVNLSIGLSKSHMLYLPYYKKNQKKIHHIKQEDQLSEIIGLIEYQEGIAYSIALLARRAYTTFEMKKKLSARIFSSPIIDEIIHELSDKKYLNDEENIGCFLRYFIKKGYGPLYMQQKLKEKFNKNFSMKDIDPFFSKEEQQEVLLRIIKKKIGTKDKTDKKVMCALYRYLQSKGFELELIIKVYKQFF